MKKPVPAETESVLLRQKAEAGLENISPGNFSSLSESDYIKLIYELHVHQVELEMQNDELQAAISRAKDANDLYDFAPTGYFTLSGESEILRLNLSGAEILGKGRTQLLNSRFAFFVSNETQPIFNLFLKRVFKNNTKESCEITLSTDRNRLIYAHIDGIVAENSEHCLVTVTDITDRKKTEDALVESERHANAIINAIPDLMFIMDLEGIFLDYRAEFRDLAYQSESIIGKRNRDIMPVEFADLIDEKIRLTHENRDTQEFEYKMEVPDRGMVDFEARMVPYSTDKIVAIVRDVTGRKKAETELRGKTESLIRVNAEKDKFFSIIAHDLRGPIGGFMGLTERLAEGMADMTLDDLQNIARVMKKSASNLFNLLGNLLEWSRMQRGLTTFEPITFQLLPKIQEIMLLAHDAATKKAIAINTAIPDNLKVFADQNMLSCIIRNLVTNAVKFTPNGGEISVLACPVKGKLIEISISDNGIGMSKDLIENLFNHDVNTNRNGTDGELSSGLGLMICKDFIEKHGGVFKVESEVTKGSVFSFRIPAAELG